MKKFAMVLGAAAVVVVAGCKDPDYKRDGATAVQNAPKSAGPMADNMKPAAPAAKQCTCAPGTRHSAPCACGGENCFCVVETKPVVVQPATPAPVVAAEPEFTVYVVRHGDYLAKISKRFNVTISSIKRLNKMTKDTVRIGQKLKIPGKVDVGAEPVAQAAPAVKAAAAKPVVKKAYAPYSGATKEYVVKNGDTLGSIAYGNGINIRQLKELNGLSGDALRIGQKLKVPASKVEKKEKAEPAPKAEEKAEPAAQDEKPAEANQPEPPAPEENSVSKDAQGEKSAAEAEPAAATSTYVVQEGDDITGVSIRFGVSAAEIRELNNLGEGDQIKSGQILKLPAEAMQ